jgi:UV DNA damage endonuclease
MMVHNIIPGAAPGVWEVLQLVRIRLGYVAMALALQDCSPSKTVTLSNLSRIEGEEHRLGRVRRLARENLKNTLRILRYNEACGVHVYRFSSKLIPLATHPLAQEWPLLNDLSEELAEIGAFAKEHRMRVSFHPDHFAVINAADEDIFRKTLKELEYHEGMLRGMNLGPGEARLVVHIGGGYGDPASSRARFAERFARVPEATRSRLAVENDDRIFGASDALRVSESLGIPMILDLHHHFCHNRGEGLADLLPDIFQTWNREIPKVHFSSPKSAADCRSHAGFIDTNAFLDFIRTAGRLGQDFDVMLEAKEKDLALFRLLEELQGSPDLEIGPGALITIP